MIPSEAQTRRPCEYPKATKAPARRFTLMMDRVSGIYDFIARAGLLARAIVYGLVSALLIAAAMAPGTHDEGYSPGDTFQRLESEPGGQIVLIMISLGLIQYAIWRAIQCIFDTSDEGSDVSGWMARLGMIMSGMSYLIVGVVAGLVLLGQNTGQGGGTTEEIAQILLDQVFGRFLLFALGAVILGIGAVQTWRGATGHWKDELDCPTDTNWTCHGISVAIAGRGLLIMLVGVFVIAAGIAGRADEARGLASLLGWLRQQPFGLWLYTLSALTIGGYGVYSLFQTVYLKIDFDRDDLPRFAKKVIA